MKKKTAKIARMERELNGLLDKLDKTPPTKDASAIIRRMGVLTVAIADAKLPKRELATIRKRGRARAKLLAKNPKKIPKKRAPKKASLCYVISARRTSKGPRMLYDGVRFSQRKTFKQYPTAEKARTHARALISKFPVLRKYLVAVETEPRPR